MKKTFNSILACGLLLMSLCSSFGQTADERKLELVVETGHFDSVSSVEFSPDGKTIVSVSDMTIKLWDVETGKEIKTLGFLSGGVITAKFSRDGRFIAAAGYNLESETGEVKIWSAVTGQEMVTINASSGYVKSVSFSPDNKILASVSPEDSIKLWEIETGKLIKSFSNSDENNFNQICFTLDGKQIISANHNGSLSIWNVFTDQLVKPLEGHTEEVTSVAVSKDFIASGSEDKTIKIWNVKTGNEVITLEGNSLSISSLAFSPDGNILVSGESDVFPGAKGESIIKQAEEEGIIKLWDIKTGKELKTLRGHSDDIYSIAVSLDGNFIASGSADDTVKLWDIASGKEIRTFSTIATTSNYISSSPDGKYLATANRDKTIKVWDFREHSSLLTLSGHSGWIDSIAFSPNGKLLASGSRDKTVRVWDLDSKNEKTILDGHSVWIQAVVFSPDGKLLASGGYDGVEEKGELFLWDVGSGKQIRSLSCDVDERNAISFSADRKKLACSKYNFSKEVVEIYIWDILTGNKVLSIPAHESGIDSISFSSDGRTLVSTSKDETIKIWNTSTGRLIKSFPFMAWNAQISPDGKFLVTGNGGAINIWNIASGQEVKYSKIPNWVKLSGETAVFSVNNEMRLLSADYGRINIINSRQETVSLISIVNSNEWIAITPDGRFDASEGALKLMHYAYGLEIINLEQLKEAYYEPGLLQKLLGFNKEPLRPIVPLKDVKLYPEIVSQTIAPDSATLRIKLKNRGGGIGKVQVFVGNELGNKLAVEDAREAKLRANPNVAEATLEIDLRGTNYLKGRENKITVVTSNYLKEIGKGNIQSRGSEIIWLADGKEEKYDELPTLYAIVGGVSDYDGERLDLRFAAKDAEDFSNALSLGAKKLFCDKQKPNCLDKVQITTLSTNRENAEEQPTKENFKKAFAAIAAKAKPEDIVVIYLAGHGVSFGAGTDMYFYLTKESRSTSTDEIAKVLQTSTISSEELTDWLTYDQNDPDDIFIKAMKQVVILDTCAAGNAAGQLALTAKRDLSGDQIRAIEFLKDKTGTFVLMGSTADAPSYEASQFGQGLLTYSLLQAMKGAALDKGEYVDIQQIFSYAQRQVPQLAQNIGGVQRPIVSAPLGKTFVIGQMTDAEKKNLNLPAHKPLLLRPLLTNPETGDDDLNLIPALRKMLDAESSYEVMRRTGKGEPQLIYIDDDNFPGAIRVTGSYIVEDKKVRVKAFLRRDRTTVAILPEIFTIKENVLNELLKTLTIELSKLTGN